MPCQAPPFSRVATCPGPTGLPAAARCARCARGTCLAAGERFRADCPGPGGTPAAKICPECRARGNLRDRRGSMATLLQQPGVTGAQLQRGWTTRVEAIVQQMFRDEFAGNEPCQYAFCIAGSGARHEASPYSDLDCFLLLADDRPSNVLFFRTATKAVSDMLIALDSAITLLDGDEMLPGLSDAVCGWECVGVWLTVSATLSSVGITAGPW